jgi:hypothetical protein
MSNGPESMPSALAFMYPSRVACVRQKQSVPSEMTCRGRSCSGSGSGSMDPLREMQQSRRPGPGRLLPRRPAAQHCRAGTPGAA